MTFRWYIRKYAGRMLIFTFVAGFCLGEFIGLQTIIDQAQATFTQLSNWISASDHSSDSRLSLDAKELSGKVIDIADGDTLTIKTGSKKTLIRLGEIDAPEYHQPWGKAARRALSKKVNRKSVMVEVQDVDRYGRRVGKVWYQQRDINREMVREGHAMVYRRFMYDRTLFNDEAHARANKLGLWRQPDPVPPWEWRGR